MRKDYIKLLASIAMTCTFVISANAQNFDVVFDFDDEDATAYLKAYSAPTVGAFANGLTGGWYNTAKAHKLLGVDLTVTANLVKIPESEEFFDFNSMNWNSLRLASGSTNTLPTLTGGSTDAQLVVEGGGTINGIPVQNDQTVDAPDGIELDQVGGRVPVPTVQLGIGIVKNTDLKIRWVPTVSFEDGEFNYWGVGVMHDIKQWIPGIKNLPFDLSVLIAHTSMNISYDINEADGNFSAMGVTSFNVNATTFQALISKKLSVFTPYTGIGFSTTSSELDLSDMVVRGQLGGASDEVQFGNIEYDGAGSPRVTAGFRLKFAVITIHADYTVQKYSMFSAGLGINVR